MIVICADDEPLSLSRLARLLSAHPDVELAASCATAESAARAIARYHPDLAVLDIEMPQRSGLELMRFRGQRPLVIFVTAHSKHAVDAFGIAAIDYVLKPYPAARLHQAIDRASARLTESTVAKARAVQHADRLSYREEDRVKYLRYGQIEAVKANGKRALAYAGGPPIALSLSLKQAKERLPSPPFYAVSRFAMVNLDHVVALEEMFHGRAEMELRSGLTVPVSRRARRALKRILE